MALEVSLLAPLVSNKCNYIELHNEINTFKYHVFAPMGRFQLELIYLYFPPSSHCYNNERPTGQKHKYTRWDDDGKF